MASHFGITSISDTPHILQSMFFGWDDTRIMPAVFRCVFLAMQPSLCLTMWSSPLAMIICDLWDSPIKRKKWTMDGSCSNYGESYPRIHRLFWGMGFTPLCHEFFFRGGFMDVYLHKRSMMKQNWNDGKLGARPVNANSTTWCFRWRWKAAGVFLGWVLVYPAMIINGDPAMGT